MFRSSRHASRLICGVAVLASAAFAPATWAASAPPGSAVNHAGEHFTLDGQPASAAAAASAATCAASPDANGAVACYSSAADLGSIGLQALKAGNLPPGYDTMPAGTTRSSLESLFGRLASTGRIVPAVAAASAASVHHSRRHHVKAHAADGYDCSNGYTYIYTDANFGGTSGHEGATGTNVWNNFSASYDNKVSSFWADPNWQSRWHDYAYGGGAYYGNGDPCRYVVNLGNASMTDGGTANDRFSSFGNW